MPKHAKQASRRSSYIPALDGLRAFAVLAVIFYHMGLGWAPGGLLGVTVFFVISGYLINGLLVAEHDRDGSISLSQFWLRRARRLLPAILFSIVGIAALCTLFNLVLLDKMRPDILPSLLFYNNWWQIFGDVSYFEAAGAASPLKHFWSLSIEEQFYVIWPILLLVLYRIGLKKTGIRRVALLLAIASAVEMALLYDPHNADPSRIYYGTDTRAVSLLIGIWLSFAAPSAAFGVQKDELEKPRGWVLFNIIGLAALAGLVALVVLSNGYDSFSYLGGIALISVLSALLIAVAIVPNTLVSRLLSLAPFVWIGKRSYGMYLWHFPIILLTTDANSTVEMPLWMRFVQIVLIFAISALSYTFIENPIRSGAIGEWIRKRRNRLMAGTDAAGPVAVSFYPPKRSARIAKKLRVAIPALAFAALAVIAGIGVFTAPQTNYAAILAGAQIAENESSADVNDYAGLADSSDGLSLREQIEDQDPEATSDDAESQTPDASSSSFVSTSDDPQVRFNEAFYEPHYNGNGDLIYAPLLIGDSVSLGAEAAFYEAFPNGCLDSVVSRNIWESPYPDYRDAGIAGPYIVFCLGTNNAVVDWQIDDDLLGSVEDDKKVILVNTRSSTDWQWSTNEAINASLERNPKVAAVVDWYGASEGHDEYFAGDGTHLTAEGAQAYIALISDALASIV